MKKILSVVIIALIAWSCGNKTQFTINGNIVPTTDGSIILFGFEEGNPTPVDTSTIEAGNFTFTGEADVPALYLLAIEGQNKYVAQFFAEAGKIDMTIYPDSFEANVITGSKTQDIFAIYMDEMIKTSKNETTMQSRYVEAQATGNQEEMENIKFEYETLIDNALLYSKNFIQEYNESPVAAYVYIMNFIEDADVQELDSILEVFAPIASSDFVVAIKQRADVVRVSGKGAEAPEIKLLNPAGEEVLLSSLRGKYVLIDFWASWCQPCMVEMPNVIAQYNEYKEKGFEIFGVSLDRQRDDWTTTIEKNQMNWVHGWDMDGAIANTYGVTGIPHTVLLDREGRIIEKNLRGEALQAKLAELLD